MSNSWPQIHPYKVTQYTYSRVKHIPWLLRVSPGGNLHKASSSKTEANTTTFTPYPRPQQLKATHKQFAKSWG